MSDVQTGIVYPKITVPGKGTFEVKFGMGATYTLEAELGITPVQLGEAIQKWFPHKDPESGEEIPGSVSSAFLFKVLAACLWKKIQMNPRDLADCFESFDDIPKVAQVVAEAFAKTRWSARKPAELATEPETPAALPN